MKPVVISWNFITFVEGETTIDKTIINIVLLWLAEILLPL